MNFTSVFFVSLLHIFLRFSLSVLEDLCIETRKGSNKLYLWFQGTEWHVSKAMCYGRTLDTFRSIRTVPQVHRGWKTRKHRAGIYVSLG